MKSEDLLALLSEAQDQFVRDAFPQKKKPVYVRWIACAACLCLMLTAIAFWQLAPRNVPFNGEGIYIEPLAISLNADNMSDMISFFIYDGRCYTAEQSITPDRNIVGEHLGTATGQINEWTPADGYVNFAGSITGDFYSVVGYDPAFMLCMPRPEGSILIFTCNTGLTLCKGADLYTHRLHLQQGTTAVYYESRTEWFAESEVYHSMNPDNAIIQRVLEEINAADFMTWERAEAAQYYLYFQQENGYVVHLLLHSDGYVRYLGMPDVCIKLSEKTHKTLRKLLNEPGELKLKNEQERPEDALQRLLNDPELGTYVPSYVPEEMQLTNAERFYYLDSATGQINGTRELDISYRDVDDKNHTYLVVVTWASEYGKNGWGGPMLDHTQLTMENLIEATAGASITGAGAWFGDVSVVVMGSGIDMELILRILQSVHYS